MGKTDGSGKLFLGVDSSTQSLKAVAIDEGKNVVGEYGVNFDVELPEYKTQGGVHRQKDGLTVTAPAIMWVAALDLLLEKMKAAGFPFRQVAAVSGSGQQHGTVYLKSGTGKNLAALSAGSTLALQLKDAFAVKDSPIWMDSSTNRQCRALEDALGGPQKVAELTGSRAYERFSGNQIAKIFQTNRGGYDASERICLVSSFMASLFAGDYVPIDASDGSGMNLMDVRSKKWSKKALDVTAAGLEARLGQVALSHSVAGRVHRYFVEKYGFDAGCVVITFSGDNPCSLAGLRLEKPGDVAISLGTSDTMFGALSEPKPSASEGHILANPIDPDGYMAMICYKNGSLTREFVRDESSGRDWKKFSQAIDRTQPGNSGNIGFYVRDPEITPPILKTGMWKFDADGRKVEKFAPDAEVRAVVEGQFLSMKLHSGNVGIKPAGILATGGASIDMSMLRVMAEVFGVPVFVGDRPNSASLGAAYRALHGWTCMDQKRFVPFSQVMKGAPGFKKVMDGRFNPVYKDMIKRYAALEKQVVKEAGG